jgi:hypothetical protein
MVISSSAEATTHTTCSEFSDPSYEDNCFYVPSGYGSQGFEHDTPCDFIIHEKLYYKGAFAQTHYSDGVDYRPSAPQVRASFDSSNGVSTEFGKYNDGTKDRYVVLVDLSYLGYEKEVLGIPILYVPCTNYFAQQVNVDAGTPPGVVDCVLKSAHPNLKHYHKIGRRNDPQNRTYHTSIHKDH